MIRRLDTDVVNKIAAGEVIQRPCSVIKELLENSLDAGATHIRMVVARNCTDLIQVQDNGKGIVKQDMNIVCERFTTSKLLSFDDFYSLITFGFRGEALASLTYVAEVTITSKTENESCGYQGLYKEGKLTSPLKLCASNGGTIISVKNLFYNMPSRLKAMLPFKEEFSKILDVVSKYALHNSSVGFGLSTENNLVKFQAPGNSEIKNNIRLLVGSDIARDVVEVCLQSDDFNFSLFGYISSPGHSLKKPYNIFFINNRLVDCNLLRLSVKSVYAAILPKYSYPFVYLSLKIPPQNVDVNIHPTKHEVRFLHEQKVIQLIENGLATKLASTQMFRTFSIAAINKDALTETSSKKLLADASSIDTAPPPKKQIRVDHTDTKLQSYFKNYDSASAGCRSNRINPLQTIAGDHPLGTSLMSAPKRSNIAVAVSTLNSTDTSYPGSSTGTGACNRFGFKVQSSVQLTSVLSLRNKVNRKSSSKLSELVKHHVFIGHVDDERILLQHGTLLYLVNVKNLSKELFYQLFLEGFSNFARIHLSETFHIYSLIMFALELPDTKWKIDDGPKEDLAQAAERFLVTKSEILNDYFHFNIDETGNLCYIPQPILGFIPPLEHLPLFLLRLTTEVRWGVEDECLYDLCNEFARFYSQPSELNFTAYKNALQFLLLPVVRNMKPPDSMSSDGTFLHLVSLPNLYRVFERC